MRSPPPFVNAGTHKKVFYKVVSDLSSETFEYKCEKLANLINECNGRVYGTMVMGNDPYTLLFSFEIPTMRVSEFERKYGS